jgi:multisubunit Na+/H+ antiporter MnhE subunit
VIALVVNIAIAVLWVILSHTPTFTSFVVGYLIGFGLIAIFSRVLGGKQYVRRALGFVRFLVLFFGQFVKANLEVAGIVLFVPRKNLSSGFIDYTIDDMTFSEALFLSHCITLTPGTITALFDWEKRHLRIHVLNYSNPSVIKKNIDQKLKRTIWMFSR